MTTHPGERVPDAIKIERAVAAPAQAVWEVLSDGWLYPLWVVGAARMRDVDDDWPAVGSRLHHSVGNWPLLNDDRTEVLDVDPGRMLTLKAHSWPLGAADVVILVEDEGSTARVRIREDVVQGPGMLVPGALRQLAVGPRNRESLRRLAYLVEGRSQSTGPSSR